jgi:membrane-associated HD superfamily phosphohydrolase
MVTMSKKIVDFAIKHRKATGIIGGIAAGVLGAVALSIFEKTVQLVTSSRLIESIQSKEEPEVEEFEEGDANE